jgi:hypothetical protein
MVGDPVSRSDVIEFVLASPRGVVATLDPVRGPEAALVDFAVTDEAELVFDSRTDARKIHNISADARVAVVVGCTGDVTLQIEGLADVLSGAPRQRYGQIYERRFPGARALVEGFSVVRVRPRWLRRYDAGVHPPRITESDWSW